jgi:methionine-gamma-lyase
MTKSEKDYRKRMIAGHELHPETLMMGYGYDPHLSEGALKPPIFLTSTFAFKNAEAGKAFFEVQMGKRALAPEEEPGLIYSRFNNPDLEMLEDRLALWDGAEDALVFSSGMAAISTTLWAFARPGDAILYSEPIYGGTDTLIQNILSQFGIKGVGFMIAGGARELERAAQDAASHGPVAAILVETPANPTNGLVDLNLCRKTAEKLERKGKRPPVIVDNTMLGPLWQQPLKHGADLCVYSLTKYIGGHSDLIGGSCVGSRALIGPVRRMRSAFGTMSDPHTGWLLMRSLETLKLRMTAAMKSARHVAEYLVDHPKVRRVSYLGFLDQNDPQYEIYNRQCTSPGSTFSFEVHGGEAEAFQLLNALRVIKLAVSLGGTESLISHPASMTHSGLPVQTQERIGVTPGLLRLSVGVEHPSDLVADLEQGLAAVTAA